MSFNPKKQLLQFLAEDIGKGDITSALLTKKKISVKIISREKGIIAGSKYAKEIFKLKGCEAKILIKDGSKIKPNQTIMKITGNASKILTCERTALNIITRMSGIATQTNQLVKKIPIKTKLYATRKTAPGLRYFDKEAVEIGGGKKHRLRLDEMVMIKDNHIAVEKSLLSLIKKTKKKYKKFEVEVENTQDAVLAAQEGATIIMLDNFSPIQIIKTIKILKNKKLRKKVLLEASGGINSKNISKYGKTGVDIISIGSITNSVKGIDVSLEI
ncbi:MAG: carboxylating nicotinate-nucleotide diphosphorylase [Nitrosopumilus sp.]|jgi:nicotinate-nucleotide pyrophosphorylase (carboxylating)|nr:carboxylating nicotinate-nucleotide diphosphorylase [Nitrosopumilus sp.]MBT3573449.1 carboxylating nicotinate-nucleotide diphosphorylase [Nitrosopumilus sp.]MBT3861611.1 carboxylating nicotinate-nucleotide diphosphorylase [Nitrosopumilus sp.]MBT3955842.1 carboxylating nicotinate-nucleotide diphosphorylase [Nitrosopumilus sp.]MBT4298779.1 carboxylating nicotinate-nucleotide diphosphorylase [Nitrosopumilus sp.]